MNTVRFVRAIERVNARRAAKARARQTWPTSHGAVTTRKPRP